ncbi:MAG: VTC domain-containing protein [Eisenbergiella sp.]
MPQLRIIESRLRPLLMPDPHTGPDGSYRISSVYFDDQWDTCFYENEDGTDPREKFRIRIYNGSDAKITLELKQKLRGKTRKLSCPLSRMDCTRALRGETLEDSDGLPPVLRKFILQQKERRLLPKVIVESERVPYIFRMKCSGNLDRTSSSSGGEISGERLYEAACDAGGAACVGSKI